jgi:hypothetical protein
LAESLPVFTSFGSKVSWRLSLRDLYDQTQSGHMFAITHTIFLHWRFKTRTRTEKCPMSSVGAVDVVLQLADNASQHRASRLEECLF